MPRVRAKTTGRWLNNQPRDFWCNVAKTDACWLWIGTIESTGYGRAWFKGRRMMAHRLAYELLHGSIPDGLTVDHLCRTRNCVNPAHMELVDIRTNILRGDTFSGLNVRKTRCPRGHVYDRVNSQGRRICTTCSRAQLSKYRSEGKCR